MGGIPHAFFLKYIYLFLPPQKNISDSIEMGFIRKGQALQFNWLFEKGAFILHPDETFSVDFSKV